MMLSLPNPLYFRNIFFTILLFFGIHAVQAQELFIGANSEFYVGGNTPFTSNGVVEVAGTGEFLVAAGNTWGDEQEYVNGQVRAVGTGTSKLPVGNQGVYAPVTAVHNGDITVSYFNSPPSIGNNGQDVDAVGSIEYWELSGNAVITLPWNENSGIEQLVNDNGGVLNSISVVGLNNGTWDLVSTSQSSVVEGDLNSGDVSSDPNQEVDLNSFSQFTFGIDNQTVLSVDDLLFSSGFNLLSNPVRSVESEIRFSSEQEFNNLKVNIYDLNGRLVRSFDKVETYSGQGQVSKGNLRSGFYFLKFEEDGRQGVKKIIIE